jgi:hypothetical protein
MEIFADIKKVNIKPQVFDYVRLIEVYRRYHPNFDLLDACIKELKTGMSGDSDLPNVTIKAKGLQIWIEYPTGVRSTYGIIMSRNFEPMYNASGEEVFVVQRDGSEAPEQMTKKRIEIIMESNFSSDWRRMLIFSLLKKITLDEFIYTLVPREIHLSDDNYKKLLSLEAAQYSHFDFTIECNDGVNVMFHKALLCIHSPMIRLYTEDVIPSPTTLSGFPFSSKLTTQFKYSFYSQTVDTYRDQDIFQIYQYLQIDCKEKILSTYATIFNCKLDK